MAKLSHEDRLLIRRKNKETAKRNAAYAAACAASDGLFVPLRTPAPRVAPYKVRNPRKKKQTPPQVQKAQPQTQVSSPKTAPPSRKMVSKVLFDMADIDGMSLRALAQKLTQIAETHPDAKLYAAPRDNRRRSMNSDLTFMRDETDTEYESRLAQKPVAEPLSIAEAKGITRRASTARPVAHTSTDLTRWGGTRMNYSDIIEQFHVEDTE